MKISPVTETVEKIDHAATGALIRKHRMSKGKSLRWLAKQMKITAPFLSDLELGRRNWKGERFNQAIAILREV